ncbi:hypothetical protein QBC42DRAFT_268477 [Cladorrhinum samala]|uniref:Uncharacterized protein n=1 Tax=Cladorrhinum samala TaxID=585594 RepID=A0AAV9HMU3_9PEZI|nr:hypothetical protein QBC42DRAFT_268477 [Cladorrhinum samala]
MDNLVIIWYWITRGKGVGCWARFFYVRKVSGVGVIMWDSLEFIYFIFISFEFYFLDFFVGNLFR